MATEKQLKARAKFKAMIKKAKKIQKSGEKWSTAVKRAAKTK